MRDMWMTRRTQCHPSFAKVYIPKISVFLVRIVEKCASLESGLFSRKWTVTYFDIWLHLVYPEFELFDCINQ